MAYLLGINALRASEAAADRVEDYAQTMRGHRVLHLVGKGDKPATMPLTVPVLRVLEACRGKRITGPLILRPISGKPIDRCDAYRMVARVAKAAGIPRHISPHSLRSAITNALYVDEALAILDEHPALAVLSDYRREQHWERGSEADAGEFDRALGVLRLLTDSDVAARVQSATAAHGLGVEDHELQFCPVCGNQTLVSSSTDSWGHGIVAATCPVCSFEQNEHGAELPNLDQEWAARWAD